MFVAANPTHPARRLVQEFAWPEEELPKRKADRGSSLKAETAAELAKEPMFCFEARPAMRHVPHAVPQALVAGLHSVTTSWALAATSQHALSHADLAEDAVLEHAHVRLRRGAWYDNGSLRHSASRVAAHSRACVRSPSCHAATSARSVMLHKPAQGSGCAANWSGLYDCWSLRNVCSWTLQNPASDYCLETAMGLYDLTDFELIWEPAMDTKCLMAWNPRTHVAVLAFRGTASMANVFADLQVSPTRPLTSLEPYASPPTTGLPSHPAHASPGPASCP